MKKICKELTILFPNENQVIKEYDLNLTDIKSPVDFKIDLNDEKICLIEFEIHRADPSNNIAKISYWLNTKKPKIKVLVIQAFTPYFFKSDTKKKAKMVHAEHLGCTLISKTYDQKYCSISTTSLTKSEFEKLYISFIKDEHVSEFSQNQLRMLVEDYVTQIFSIINDNNCAYAQ